MKEKFVKSTFILLVGGVITKFLSLVIKMVLTRLISVNCLGNFMLILPTFFLFINLSQLGIPFALAKLVAEDRRNNKSLFISSFVVTFFINVILVIIIIFSAYFISKNLFHNSSTYYGLIAIAFVIPFTTISSIINSYFIGKEKMIVKVIADILSLVVRFLVIIVGVLYIKWKNDSFLLWFLISSNLISEIISIIIYLCFIPKKNTFRKNDFVINKGYLKDVFSIGIPNTITHLIGNIGYFLEPIILSNVLLKVGYLPAFISREYGILSGYVLPILLLPSFFTSIISQALLPNISRDYSNKNIFIIRKKMKFVISFSTIMGCICALLFMLFPRLFLNIIYNTNLGENYMRLLAPFCIFQYLEAPLTSILIAMGRNKDILISNFLAIVVRISFTYIFSYFRISIYGLIIGKIFDILIIFFYQYTKLKLYLKTNCK